MNIVITPEEIKQLERIHNCSVYIADPDFGSDRLFLAFLHGEFKTQSIKLPKKKAVDNAWVESKVVALANRENNYENLRSVFEKLDIQGNIYFTSFGFSYDMFMKSEKKFNEDTDKIKRYLIENNINYTTEFSDAFWVLRFKISKANDNLERIKQLAA